MKTILFVCATAVAFVANQVYAADLNSPQGKQAAEDCRRVLEENFYAIMNEDINALMATTSSQTAAPEQMAEFRAEAEKMFETTDVYMRVDDFVLYKLTPPYAYAYVNQLTMPKNEEDHYPAENGALNFKHHSALLPEHRLVQYDQKFHFENGKWKLHRVISEPRSLDDWSVRDLKQVRANIEKRKTKCANGKCDKPFVRVLQ